MLHRGQALHRDLTPFNVFVCEDEQLKLGDFGIATHQLSRRGVTADAFNVFNAPTEIAWGKSSPLAAARRHLPGRADRGDAAARRHHEPDAQSRRARPPVQRPPQGGHPPLPRRARQALRGGGRADRRAAAAADSSRDSGRVASLDGQARLVHGFPQPAAQRGDRRREEGGRDRAGEARASRRTCSCAAGRTRCRSRAPSAGRS